MTDNKNEFYKKQITQVRANLLDLLNSLDEAQLQTQVFSEGNTWTVLDIVAHLLENERAMSIHVHKIRTGRETLPESFDLEEWNASLQERTEPRSLAELLTDMATVRDKTLELLATIEDNEWALQGRHPLRQTITIEQFYETMAGHDSWHIKDIRQALGMV